MLESRSRFNSQTYGLRNLYRDSHVGEELRLAWSSATAMSGGSYHWHASSRRTSCLHQTHVVRGIDFRSMVHICYTARLRWYLSCDMTCSWGSKDSMLLVSANLGYRTPWDLQSSVKTTNFLLKSDMNSTRAQLSDITPQHGKYRGID